MGRSETGIFNITLLLHKHSCNFKALELRSKDESYFFDDRESEQDAHSSHNNIMSIQSMLNNSSNAIARQELPPQDEDEEEYTEKSWRPMERKRKDREV